MNPAPPTRSGGFFALVADRPVAVLMLFVAAAVFGLVSYDQLSLELMPGLSYPTLTVRTEIPGAAPEEVENQVSIPLEEQLATTDGLVHLQSRSRAELSDVLLELDWGTDMGRAAQAVRERLQAVQLPDEAKRPLILRYDPGQDPILRAALAFEPGREDLGALRRLADEELKPGLEAMEGVAAVKVRGGLEREVHVELREDWLAARGVTVEQVEQALSTENVDLAGGTLREGDTEYLIRTLGEVSDLDALRRLQVRRADGVPVALDQVAEIGAGWKDRRELIHLDGQEAVELEIYKEADANVVSVARSVKRALDPDELPDGVRLELLDDQAAFIEAAIGNLRNTAVIGGLLAVLVLFLFLRDFRSTAIIATAIPLSVVVAFAGLYIGGISLNLMSLGGLALGVGMLVDNAVVVLEAIHVHREAGRSRRDAAISGVREVAAAVTASTLTTVAVFLPISFVEGVAGQVFGDLSLAVVLSLLASLVVALVFVPMLAARSGGPRARPSRLGEVAAVLSLPSVAELRASWRRAREGGVPARLLLPYALLRFALRFLLEIAAVPVVGGAAWAARGAAWVGRRVLRPLAALMIAASGAFGRAYDGLAALYPLALDSALAKPGAALGLALLALLLAAGGARGLGGELVPEVHQGRLDVRLALPVGTPLSRTSAVVGGIERSVAAQPEVDSVFALIGSERGADAAADEGEHSARLVVGLRPAARLAAQQGRVVSDLRRRVSRIPHLEASFSSPAMFTLRPPLEVIVYGRDLDALSSAAARARDVLERLPGLRDVRSSLERGYPELRVRYDRRVLQRLGLATEQVARALRDKVQGARPTRMLRGNVKEDVVVRLVEGDRDTRAELSAVNVNPRLVPQIPLSAVASIEAGEGPSEIRRVDQRRAVVLSAGLAGFDLAAAARSAGQALSTLAWPAGTDFEIGGQSAEMARSVGSMGFALLLAVFLVYVIMASLFESLLDPLVILLAVPLAAVGVVGALLALDVELSVVVFIGLIVLAGVVVNNAIVLVDLAGRLARTGLDRAGAAREAARARLRPILITTATTVLGLLPLALGLGSGAEIQRPLAITVIAGLSTSTLLTLLVIPAAWRLAGALAWRGR